MQLRPLVEKVVSRLSSMAEDQQSRVSVDVDYAVYFDVDGEQLTEMLFATTQNSLEALRQGGQVTIRCDWVLGQSELRIRIIDDGPGISPEVRRHVFDPFFSGREAGRERARRERGRCGRAGAGRGAVATRGRGGSRELEWGSRRWALL